MIAIKNGTVMTITQGTLEAGTVNAAKIIGVVDRVGGVKAGKDADILAFSGHSFDYRTMAELVSVDSRVVYMRKGGESWPDG